MTPVAGQEHNSQARTRNQASARSSSSYPPGHPTPALMARQAHTGNASTRKCPRTHADTSLERQHPAVSRTAKREPQNTTIMTVSRRNRGFDTRPSGATQPPVDDGRLVSPDHRVAPEARIEMHLPLPDHRVAPQARIEMHRLNIFTIRTQIDQTPQKRALHRICVRIMKFRARFRYASCARYSTTWRFPGRRVGPQGRSRHTRTRATS